MSRLKTLISTLCLLASCASTKDEPRLSQQLGTSSHEDFVWVPQTGTPYENGLLHGRTCKVAIEEQLTGWSEQVRIELGLRPVDLHRILSEETGFVSTIRASCPNLLDEIRGVADGAAVDPELLLAFNLGEEIASLRGLASERCSNLAVATPSGSLVAYNQDLPLFLHGSQRPVILAHPDALVFAMPGSIGISGASRFAAVTCNSLPMLRMDANGLPLSFALREALALKSGSEVVDYFRSTTLAVAQNLMIATREGVWSFEKSRQQTCELSPGHHSALIHTNFPIENQDLIVPGWADRCCARYSAMTNLLEQWPTASAITIESLASAFSEAPLANEQTYLHFTALYPRNFAPPLIEFVNPSSSSERHTLPFPQIIE